VKSFRNECSTHSHNSHAGGRGHYGGQPLRLSPRCSASTAWTAPTSPTPRDNFKKSALGGKPLRTKPLTILFVAACLLAGHQSLRGQNAPAANGRRTYFDLLNRVHGLQITSSGTLTTLYSFRSGSGYAGGRIPKAGTGCRTLPTSDGRVGIQLISKPVYGIYKLHTL
jgi:hypothetical protein